MRKILWFLLTLIILICVLAILRYNYVFVVEGAIMEPAFMDGEIVHVVLGYTNYQRGDVVVFKDPTGTRDSIISRIIGLPGETLEAKDSEVSVNGVVLNEPYATEKTLDFKIVLDSEGYYLMSDKRFSGVDPRLVGPITEIDIIGKIK